MRQIFLKSATFLGFFTAVIGVLILFFGPLCIHAQEVVQQAIQTGAPIVDQNTSDFIKFLIESLGGLKGASALAIAGIVVQILIRVMNLPMVGKFFSETKGWIKLMIVTGLTLVGGVIGLMTAGGLTFGAALLHSTTLAALMVFGNQIIQQFWKPKEESKK